MSFGQGRGWGHLIGQRHFRTAGIAAIHVLSRISIRPGWPGVDWAFVDRLVVRLRRAEKRQRRENPSDPPYTSVRRSRIARSSCFVDHAVVLLDRSGAGVAISDSGTSAVITRRRKMQTPDAPAANCSGRRSARRHVFARPSVGIKMPIKSAMIPMTTSNSTSVKAEARVRKKSEIRISKSHGSTNGVEFPSDFGIRHSVSFPFTDAVP